MNRKLSIMLVAVSVVMLKLSGTTPLDAVVASINRGVMSALHLAYH